MTDSEPRVYAHYTQAELDVAYSQRVWADNMDSILARWAQESSLVRAGISTYREARYGGGPDEVLDIYSIPGKTRLAHFHIHGGAWKSQSKSACAFMAPLMIGSGINLIAPEFGKLPSYRMPDVLSQLIRALVWTYNDQIRSGAADKLLISGHSSGAHMAALLAQQDWRSLGIDARRVLGVVCISGCYDLEPVLLSARADYIDLDKAEARRLSPIHHVGKTQVPLHVLYGSRESPEFIRQARAFAGALRRGERLATCSEIAGKNHFEILDAISNPDDPVTKFVLGLAEESEIDCASTR